jgi:hypothetical protein
MAPGNNDKRDTTAPQKNEQNDLDTREALKEAEKDISNDPDLSPAPDPAEDLDEGELARLEGEE